MARKLLRNLSSDERQTLFNHVYSYINDSIVMVHANGHDWHHTDTPLFFTRHRDYLAGLESYLRGIGAAQFTPLPAWDPADEIPTEFRAVKPSDNGTPRPPLQNFRPNRPMPSNLAQPALCAITNAQTLARSVEAWHDGVHGAIGGTMSSISIAPSAPIFWCWHAFVDEIYYNWERCRIFAGGDPQGNMGNVARVVYRGIDSHIHELYLTNQWYHFDMNGVFSAPAAAGDPMGYFAQVPRVVYRGQDGHVYELAIYPETGAWGVFNMSGGTGAPAAAGNPMGYVAQLPRVVYRGQDNHIHEIHLTDTWHKYDLTAATGAPAAAGDPMGYFAQVPRVVYRGQDGHVYELGR